MDNPFGDLMNILNSPCTDTELRSRADRETFPLTDVQLAYKVARNRGSDPAGPAAYEYVELDCPAVDHERLAVALDRVVARHDMLRAVTVGDQAQRVLSQVPPCTIAALDLRGAGTGARERALDRIRREMTRTVRSTERWPSFEVRVTDLDGGRSRLHVVVDALFVDPRSLSVVLADWHRCYRDDRALPTRPRTSFRDHVLGRAAALDSDEGDRAREYWASRLETLPDAPELPLATSPEHLGTTTTRLGFELDDRRWGALRALAAARGLTGETALLGAYCEVLRTWSKNDDLTVTVSLAGRPGDADGRDGAGGAGGAGGADGAVGNFLTPNLLAVPDRRGRTFADRACAMQTRLAEDRAHSVFGGFRVLRELARTRADHRTVSMPVVFTSTVGARPGGDALTLFGRPVHGAGATPRIWLENRVHETGGGLAVSWEVADGLLPDGTAEAMLDAYRGLLERMAEDTGVWDRTDSVVGLPPSDARVRDRVNATAATIPPRRLHELVAQAAERTPDAVAVIAGGVETTFRDLTEDAHRLARRLRATGVGTPNTLVAVSMPPGAALVAALLAVQHSGAAYVSIDPELPEQRRHALLDRCRAEVVVTDPDLRDRLTWPDGVRVVTGEDPDTFRFSSGPVPSRQGLDDLAYVIFTSGSTGEPKGVMISHRAAANTVQDINERFSVGPDDRVLALAPTNFDLSVYDVFGVLGAGGALVVPDPDRAQEPQHWTELVDRHRVTIWNSVPAPMRLWVDSPAGAAPASGSSVRLALLSGDWIPTTLPGRISERYPGMEVISLGGATEASIWSVHHPIRHVDPDRASIPYGTPLANQTLHVYDDRLEPCPTWVTGEIYIGGVGVAQGYWADPARTGERFVRHPATGERVYRTGDLGRYLPGGDIEILGRTDFQVKINGYRIELGEIEVALCRRPGVREAMVTAPAHPQSGQRQLAAYVVPHDGAHPDPDAIREALALVLPGYMVPGHVVVLDALPLTANGKIDRAALPPPRPQGDDGGRRTPRSDIEERLLRIWTTQLGHGEVGVEDGFFDVGGDSLHAVGIIDRLRTEFGLDDATEQRVVEDLFTNASIAEFAQLFEAHAGLPA